MEGQISLNQDTNVKEVFHKIGLPSRSLGASDTKAIDAARLRSIPAWQLRKLFGAGADDGIRTRDLRFTKPLLYQLSYVGAGPKDCIGQTMRQENMAGPK